jgi:hypothetical protein
VSNQRSDELALLVPTAYQSIFVPSINLGLAETETANEPVVFLSLQRTRSVENVLRRVVNDLNVVVPVLKQIALLRPRDIDFLGQFLLFQVPN